MKKPSRRFLVSVDGTDVELTIGKGYVQLGDDRLPFSFRELSHGWYHLVLGERGHSVFLDGRVDADGFLEAAIDGRPGRVAVRTERDLLLDKLGLVPADSAADRMVRAPMPGLVLETLVEAGRPVKKGDGLLVLEAMKMENEIRASADGTVKLVHVQAGDAVTKNDLLVELE